MNYTIYIIYMILIIIEEYNNGIISINGRTKYKLYNNATTVFDLLK